MAQENLNLVPAILAMLQEKENVIQVAAQKIREIEDGVKALRKLNTVCEECRGKGKYLRTTVSIEDEASGTQVSRDWVTCHVCHGTGHVNPWAADD